MSSLLNSVAPQGAGGKDTSHLNPDVDRNMTDDEVDDMANVLGCQGNSIDLNDWEAVIEENLRRSRRNLIRAQQRADPAHIEVPDNDESFLDEPPSPLVTPAPTSFLAKKIAKAYRYVGSLTPTMRKLVHSISGIDGSNPTVPTPSKTPVEEPSSSTSVSTDTYTFTKSNTKIA